MGIRIYFDKRSKLSDGTYPLKLSVSYREIFFRLNLGIYLTMDQWKEGQVVNHPKKKTFNASIKQKILQAEHTILNLRTSNQLQGLTAKELKSTLENSNEELNSEYTLEDHYKKCISKAVAKNTKALLEYSLSCIKKYDSSSLLFSDINVAWLQDFEKHLSKSLRVNTRSIILRNIRTVFLDAINHDLISQSIYPFRKFKIKSEKTIKRSLTREDLITLRDYPCEKHQVKYRDLFMLIFYLIGINIVDLLFLKEIRSGRIEYRRAKTGRLYSVEVLPQAMEIINRYRGKNYLLDVMDHYTTYKDFVHRMNENLQRIGPFEQKGKEKIRTPLFPALTTYYGRHTWATIAASLDIPKETISAGLGHELGNETTSIYIDFDLKKVDRANKKVIKSIFS